MIIQDYIDKINTRFKTGISTEHSYRGDLQNLLESIATDVLITNEPTHIDCGAPDYILTKKNIPVGYIEAKDIGADLNSKNYKEQFDRYRASLSNLIFTDYLNFQLYHDGEFVLSISIAKIENNKIVGIPQKYEEFQNLIKDFAAHIGQTIKSAEKLSKMMAGKARMLASVIENALKNDDADLQNTAHEAENNSLRDQLTAFKQVLIHDITQKEFADIYAQTIAYGMFAARFHDPTLETFSRQEAAELIPKSNPFLRKLFQYVAGYDLDDRLKWIVEALVDIFRATDVAALLKNFGKATQQNDPIIHFYETFLGEYDPKLRKARGVWYTPEPVVNFIVRAVDDILKTEFGLPQGLADTCKIKIKQKIVTKATADQRSKLKEVEVEQEVHKVQILDPACGTGTFLAEIIKHIYKKFEGQQGIWSRYVDEHLIPRLNGFEILMASYAMAHLKLDLLLANTGYKPQKDQRFKIYLTNSLEEHHPDTGTLFANWLSSEANEANYVKRDTPVMVVLGNPPYSVSSSNKGEWIQNLIADYKKDLNEKKINLDDDYIKFIRYGQYLIDKNGEGILAYISNNSFIDGITHRRMRKHLLETFDKIYILDLHGSTKKNEVCLDGSKDENVFDIQQGVSINLFVKNNKKKKGELADVMHFDLFGTRVEKYNNLFENNLKEIKWNKLEYKEPYFFFVPKKINDLKYDSWFSITELFVNVNNGVKTDRDSLFIDERKLNIENRFKILLGVDIPQLFIDEYRVIDSGSFKITERIKAKKFNSEYIKPILYRPFDIRYIYYDPQIVSRPAQKVMQHMLKDNLALLSCRQQSTFDFQHILVSKVLSEVCTVSLQTKETTYVFPLYLYPETTGQQNTEQTAPPNLPKGEAKSQFTEQTDSEVPSIGGDLGGVRTPNLNKEIALKIARSIRYMYDPNDSSINFSYRDTGITLIAPIDILDYIYAVLHSPTYREKYKEFLKIDFPRVPYPRDAKTFWQLVKLGGELREIHLLESPIVEKYITQYPIDGNNVVEKIKFVISPSQTPTYSPKGGEPASAVEENENMVNDFGWQTANAAFYKGIKEERERLKAEMTDAEKLLWKHLKTKQLGAKFRRQHIIDRFIPDFVCLQYKLIIEVDGGIHKFQKEYDEGRTAELNNLGYRVVRFTNEQVLNDIDFVLKSITSILKEQSLEEAESPSFGGVGEVFINETQYFSNVPEVAWEFYIGGYQPAQKWLKDRKGRTLTFDDISHYQKIIVALTETDRIMKEIDKIETE